MIILITLECEFEDNKKKISFKDVKITEPQIF
jgi:hypothetical protein